MLLVEIKILTSHVEVTLSLITNVHCTTRNHYSMKYKHYIQRNYLLSVDKTLI